MEKNQNQLKPHIIIIAPPFQGHLNPSIQLTLNLASKSFTVTFVNTDWTHHQITKARKHLKPENNDHLFSGSGLDIRYRTISDGFPLSFDRSLNREQYMEGRIHVFPTYVDEFVGQLMGSGSDPPPTCLVADTFYTWGSTIARKYALVHVSFWTQPALVLTLYYHLDLLKKKGHYGANRKLVSSNEIAERIKFFMSGERSHELRNAVEEVRKKVENALSSNGSSKKNFDKFVEDLKAKIESNKN
ncbi:hypothetical protein BUALT_Bualt09G0079000 [Buddleja alternifolia]|uniref:Uncharacterized protein n=1 Tax=Buddleja alternifolia TaxID=168488 RepID=A0AAV6X071_9LAMI|nr:hypothetical protein BUALT_Bualt09G0079000 [Buddleja alternifolia]